MKRNVTQFSQRFFSPWHPLPLFWAFAFLLVQLVPAFAKSTEFPTPKWLESATVSKQMIINGLPSSVQYFTTTRKMEDLLDFYRRSWNDGKAGGKGFREVTVPPWHILARLEGRYIYTVQAKQGDPFTVNGYLAIADLEEAKKIKMPESDEFPKMKGSRVLNLSSSVDPGQKGTTLMLVNGFSLDNNAEYYRNYYEEDGWTSLMDIEKDNARVLTYQKFNKQVKLVIHKAAETTQVVMNLVEHE